MCRGHDNLGPRESYVCTRWFVPQCMLCTYDDVGKLGRGTQPPPRAPFVLVGGRREHVRGNLGAGVEVGRRLIVIPAVTQTYVTI